jgi:DNA gyrase subunit B
MYIGGTGSKGVHHILWEIVDNSMDEIANGHGNQISVTLHKDGSATVEDDGRGIPVDPHPTLKISGAEVVFTQLHAGGKFDSSNYSYSGGLHGVGASVTNALSSWLKATVYRNKKIYEIDFASVADANGNVKGGVVQNPLHEVGVCPANKTGTRVTFMPDPTIFMNSVLNSDTIRRRLRELAFLNKGVEINFIDEKEGQTHNYKFDGGLADFVEYLNESKTTLFRPAVSIEGEAQGIKLSAALQYTDSYAETVISYVNNIPTSEGGTHEVGFKTALTKVMNDCARKLGFLKDKELNLMGEDFREGITLIFAIKMQNIQFEGQTKTKLGNPEVKAKVEVIVNNELPKAFESKEGQKIFEQIIEKAKGAARVRLAAKKAKEVARQKNSIESSSLIGKLANCSSRKPEQNELFIVEGDSAGGSAKQARDRSFQAILPLKGKPLNAEKKRLDQVLANEEIRTIIAALGTGVGEDFDIDYLKYHKIIILSDADQDGAHIRAILLTFFYRYMKELLYNGNIYIGLPPLYKVSKKDTIEYVYSDKELPEATERVGRGYAIQRYKGLGEMNPDQLWETTMDPSRRTLVRVGVDDAANAEEMVTVLMGDDIESRKEYISTYVNFNKVDMLSKIVEK